MSSAYSEQPSDRGTKIRISSLVPLEGLETQFNAAWCRWAQWSHLLQMPASMNLKHLLLFFSPLQLSEFLNDF